MKTMIVGLFLAAGLSVSAVSVAEEYTVEGGISWWNFDGADAWSTDITTYFSPVVTQGLPLAEASFLNQAGSLRIDYTRNDDDDYDLAEGMLEVYANDYYAAIGASRFANQFDDLDSFGLQVGRMVAPAISYLPALNDRSRTYLKKADLSLIYQYQHVLTER